MKIEIYPNLYIANESACTWSPPTDWAIIHACKHPCHRHAVGYRNNLPPTDPNYLIWERGNHLVLNMVDMDKPFSPRFTNPIIKSAMMFISENIQTKKIIIHCNQGQSRSPSIGLLYLARINKIDSTTYQTAKSDFKKLYQKYSPGLGIRKYLNKNWNTLIQLK